MRQAVEKEDRSACLLGLNRRLILRRLVVNGFEEKGAFTQNTECLRGARTKTFFFCPHFQVPALESSVRVPLNAALSQSRGMSGPVGSTCLVILRRVTLQ